MLASYEDITSRLGKALWYDENGTPRYEKFRPELSPNIYADEVILMKIGCQGCTETFLVEMSYTKTTARFRAYEMGRFEEFKNGTLFPPFSKMKYLPHYGDPPRHNDMAGNTMNCIDLKCVELWKRNKGVWQRVKKNLPKGEDPDAT